MPNTSRLFIAVDLDDTFSKTVDAHLSELRVKFNQGVKWERADKFHLTLAFLGDTPDRLQTAIIDVCKKTAEAAKPFNLRFDRLGTFPPRGVPSVLWLGCAEQPALRQLAAGVRTALKDRKIQFDSKPFLPHLSLARVKRDCPNPAELAEEFLAFKFNGLLDQTIKSVTIYRSELRREGAVYTILAKVAFEEN